MVIESTGEKAQQFSQWTVHKHIVLYKIINTLKKNQTKCIQIKVKISTRLFEKVNPVNERTNISGFSSTNR